MFETKAGERKVSIMSTVVANTNSMKGNAKIINMEEEIVWMTFCFNGYQERVLQAVLQSVMHPPVNMTLFWNIFIKLLQLVASFVGGLASYKRNM